MLQPPDVDKYVRAMLYFVDHPNEIAAFGSRARAKAGEYSPTRGVETLVAALVDICSDRDTIDAGQVREAGLH